ncbi:MAG: hypothetical protein IT294_02565 [Deltaproteobacteria bacterium]|nr:hypothetical protein [Deltaproteobacteria bacterium]
MIIRHGRSIASAAAVLTLSVTSVAAAQLVPIFDHLKCYAIKDYAPKAVYKVDLLPEQRPPFNLETGCKVVVPAKLFCIDVAKQNAQPPPPGAAPGPKASDYLCYKLACPKQTLPTLLVNDQFGSRDVTVKPPKFLCAPATKEIQHQTPTPTATATPIAPTETPTATRTPGCAFDTAAGGGQCAGPCPPSGSGNPQQCVFVINADGTADCDCREPDPACQSAGAHVCAGPCPDPRDQCRVAPDDSCVCSHPCSLDPTAVPQCSGDCPDPTEVCVVNTTGGCDCRPPNNPPCGGTIAPTCDGACPNPGEACVPNGPTSCFCETGTPPPCGQLAGNPQCLGACPAGLACVAVGPVPGGGCTCQ